MVGVVIVSHSRQIAEGVVEFCKQMVFSEEAIIKGVGGLEDGSLGTDIENIATAIRESDLGDGVVILADLGSSILSADMAVELLGEEAKSRVKIADAPIVEGAFAAVVQASLGSPLENVVASAENARSFKKLNN